MDTCGIPPTSTFQGAVLIEGFNSNLGDKSLH